MNIVGSISYPTPRMPLWRIKHDIEIDRDVWRPRLPEVHPFLPNHHVPFTKYWQLLSKSMNPRITGTQWRDIYHWRLWITNHQGFDKPEDDRRDYVNMRDLDKEHPRVEMLTCGGSVVTGYEKGDWLVVNVLSGFDPAPSIEWMNQHPEYWTWAVSCDSGGTPRRFPQFPLPSGEMLPSVHPLIGDPRRFTELVIPKYKVELWTGAELPDPWTLYNPLR